MSGVATAVVAGAVIGGIATNMAAGEQADAATQAASTQADANKYAADLQYRAFKDQMAMQKPWLTAGENALARLSGGLAPGGEFGTKFSQTNWQQDPGYAFRLAEGQKALERSAAARGGLISGNALKAAERYGQEMGSQEYQNAFNRYYREREAMLNPLQSLAGVGQTTAQSLGGAAQQLGTNVGNLASATGASTANSLLAAGQARASAYQGYGSALGQGIGGLANYLNYGRGNTGYVSNTGYTSASPSGAGVYDYGGSTMEINTVG
jgi:hypothetical protein